MSVKHTLVGTAVVLLGWYGAEFWFPMFLSNHYSIFLGVFISYFGGNLIGLHNGLSDKG